MEHTLGLILDLDGTVVDSEGLNAKAAGEGFHDLKGVSGMGEADFIEGVGMGLVAYIKAGAAARNIDVTEEDVQQLVAAWEDNAIAILEQERLPTNPGIPELIEAALGDSSFGVAIGTSCSRRLSMAMMKAASVPYDQMGFVCGDDVVEKKPHPRIFLEACAKAGLAPDQCCVLEDSPAGVEAALNAGCKCIALTSDAFGRTKLAKAHLVVDSFEEIDLETVSELIAA